MAKFLNTQGLSEWIPRIIDETEKELIIITPYMQLSDKIYNALLEANKRGVETIIVYRNKLSDIDRSKLLAIDNLNLMHQSNLHAKCFYNEKYLLIASMNLYEFSEKNNREMGVLLHKVSIDDENSNGWNTIDDDQIFKDGLFEIRNIIKSSELEKASRETIEDGFEMDILKTDKEKKEEYCKILNKYFVHKKFEAANDNGLYEARCNNYFDNIDVVIDYRTTIHFKHAENHLELLHKQFESSYDEFMFDGFKFYWNYYGKNKAHLYKDSRHPFWKNEISEAQTYNKLKEGINKFVQLLKPLTIQK